MLAKKSYIGQLLVANPSNPKDNFDHSVILVVSYSDKASFGLQINKPMLHLTLKDIGDQLDLFIDSSEPIYYGGIMNADKIHVVHSNDWAGVTTVPVNDEISLTNDISILAAISAGEGPEYHRACAGFYFWEFDQMTAQIEAGPNSRVKHRWEYTTANIQNVFESGHSLDQWHRVIRDSAQQQISAWF
jgi:putative transcriptional regulator